MNALYAPVCLFVCCTYAQEQKVVIQHDGSYGENDVLERVRKCGKQTELWQGP